MTVLKAIEVLAANLNREADQEQQQQATPQGAVPESVRLKRQLARRMVDTATAAAQGTQGDTHPVLLLASWLRLERTDAPICEDAADAALYRVLELNADDLLDVAADHRRLQRMERELQALQMFLIQEEWMNLQRTDEQKRWLAWCGDQVRDILRPPLPPQPRETPTSEVQP